MLVLKYKQIRAVGSPIINKSLASSAARKTRLDFDQSTLSFQSGFAVSGEVGREPKHISQLLNHCYVILS